MRSCWAFSRGTRGALRNDVLHLYLGLRGLGHDRPRFVLSAPGCLDDEKRRLAAAGEAVIAATAGMSLKATAAGNRERVRQCLAWLPETRPTWEDLERAATFVPSMRCGALRPIFEEWNASLKEFRRALGGHYLWPLAGLVDRLLTILGEEYVHRKTELGLLDFNDVEIRALELLDSGVRPYADAARLMVDEFQDTNGLQCRLIEKLGVATVLTVGDLYQSIYGFRGADVEVFRGQETSCVRKRFAERLSTRGCRCNFRSRRAVLSVINRIFSHAGLFGEGFPHLEAARAGDEPRAGLPDERGELSPAVELVVLDRGDAGRRRHDVAGERGTRGGRSCRRLGSGAGLATPRRRGAPACAHPCARAGRSSGRPGAALLRRPGSRLLRPRGTRRSVRSAALAW